MFYAERIECPVTSGLDTWIAERGVFMSISEFVPFRKLGWSGTDTTNKAADEIIAKESSDDQGRNQ